MERRAPTHALEAIPKVTEYSAQAEYLLKLLPRSAKLLGKLATNQDDPFSRMWTRYMVARVDEAQKRIDGASELGIDLRSTILPLAKGTTRIVKDGRMATQMARKEQSDVVVRMAEIVSSPTINRAERIILGSYAREPFLAYAEYLVSTAGRRPSRIKPTITPVS